MKVKRIISIILVIAWMSIVFYFSAQQGEGSGKTSKTVSKIVINIIDIGNRYTEVEKEELIETIEPVIRKIAHYTLYTIGGILIANCTFRFLNEEKKAILVSGIVGIAYATSDEIHQLLVAGRSGKVQDVIIDSLGILTGIIFFLLITKILERIISNFKKDKECLVK